MQTFALSFEPQDEYRMARAAFDGWHEIASDPEILFATGEPEGADQALLDGFVAREAQYYRLISDHLKTHYRELLARSEFIDVFDEDDPVYPSDFGYLTEETMRNGDVLSLIRLTSVLLLSPDKNAIGFCFECAWDEEHGLGIVIFNDEVICCDGEQEAYACLNFPLLLDMHRRFLNNRNAL